VINKKAEKKFPLPELLFKVQLVALLLLVRFFGWFSGGFVGLFFVGINTRN